MLPKVTKLAGENRNPKAKLRKLALFEIWRGIYRGKIHIFCLINSVCKIIFDLLSAKLLVSGFKIP
jgi:hypothetical protein